MAAPAWNETGSEIELTTLSGAEEASDSLASVEPRAYSVPSFDISSNDNVEYDASEATSVASTDCNEDADATLESESEFPRTRSARVIPIDAAAEGAYDGYDLAPLATTSSDAAASERWPPSANDLGAESPLSSLTPYNRFLERLKHRSCVDTIRAVKGLLAMFPGQMSRSDAAAVVHNFIDIHTPRLLSTDPFVALAEDERAASAEFFEKFTLQKLYPQCYSMDPNDRIEDERLWIKMRCLDWVEPKHLEVPSAVDTELLAEAQVQLKNISRFKAPRDKMVGILNCCRLVVHALEGTSNAPASADETLPLLIYVTIRANPHELWSSIEFIQHFRHPSRHIAEEAYAFTLLVSAVEYIKTIGITAHFKMDAEEFNKLFSEAQEPYLSRLEKLQAAQDSTRHADPNAESLAAGDNSVLGRLKRMAQPALLFKSVLYKNLASPEINEAIGALSTLEANMRDIPLEFKPDSDADADASALLSDWRALTAMRAAALDTVAKVIATLSKVTQ